MSAIGSLYGSLCRINTLWSMPRYFIAIFLAGVSLSSNATVFTFGDWIRDGPNSLWRIETSVLDLTNDANAVGVCNFQCFIAANFRYKLYGSSNWIDGMGMSQPIRNDRQLSLDEAIAFYNSGPPLSSSLGFRSHINEGDVESMCVGVRMGTNEAGWTTVADSCIYGGGTVPPIIPPAVSCSFKSDILLEHGVLNSLDVNGNRVSRSAELSCSKKTSVKISFINSGKVNLDDKGYLYSQLFVNDKQGEGSMVVDTNAIVDFSSVLHVVNGEYIPGEYMRSVIAELSIL